MYQGESIAFLLCNDRQTNLDESDFEVFIYPTGCPDNTIKYDKSECTRLDNGNYMFRLEEEDTLDFCGPITVELHDKSCEKVFVENSIERFYHSASKMQIEEDNEENNDTQNG